MAIWHVRRTVLQLALRRARTWARDVPDIVAIGIGHKHRNGDYVDGSGLCLKFLVHTKTATPAARIPEAFIVRHKGREHAIRTDVEEVGHMEAQGLTCNPAIQPDHAGSVGFFVRSKAGRYAITAGHVVGPHRGPVVQIDGVDRGTVISHASLVIIDDLLLDVGSVELSSADTTWFESEPWRHIQAVVSPFHWGKLLDKKDKKPRPVRIFGAAGMVVAAIDNVVYQPCKFPPSPIPYASPLLFYRALDGAHFAGGFSGAPVTDLACKRLIGVHVAGDDTRGAAQSASRFMSALRDSLGHTVRLAGPSVKK